MQWVSSLETLKTLKEERFSQGVIAATLNFYRQNQLFSIAGLFLLSLILLVLIMAASAGKSQPRQPQRHGDISFQERAQQSNNDVIFTPQDAYAKIKYNLEIIALSIVQGDDWNKQHIVDFAYSWNELSGRQKAQVKQTVWFQLLENALVNIVGTEEASGFENDRTKLLTILSDKLDIKIPTAAVSVASSRSSAAEKPVQPAPQAAVVAANSAEDSVAKAGSQRDTAGQKEALAKLEKEKLEKELFQQPAPQTAKQSTMPPAEPSPALSSAQGVNSAAQNTEVAAAEVSPTVRAAQPASPQGSSEAGAAADQKRNNLHRIIRTPPTDAQDLNVVVASNNAAASASKQNPASSAKAISNADLNKLTAQLVNSYEKGNIDSFTSLFSPNAVSNDEADLKTITKDYADLFATTSDRRMIIGDIKWNFANNTASGSGSMEVAVKPSGANKAQKYTGKIQIVVERQANGVQITRLFHELK